jgi:hypothetical protein
MAASTRNRTALKDFHRSKLWIAKEYVVAAPNRSYRIFSHLTKKLHGFSHAVFSSRENAAQHHSDHVNVRFWPKAEVRRAQCNSARSGELSYFMPAVVAAISKTSHLFRKVTSRPGQCAAVTNGRHVLAVSRSRLSSIVACVFGWKQCQGRHQRPHAERSPQGEHRTGEDGGQSLHP